MTPLALNGRRIEQPRDITAAALLGCEILSPRFRFGLARDNDAACDRDSSIHAVDARPDSIVIAHFPDQVRLITRYDQFEEESRRLAENTRGGVLADLACTALEIFDLHPARPAVRTLAELVETRLDRPPGLYPLQLVPNLRVLPSQSTKIDAANGPLLVFLHGTASSTTGSFRDLACRGALEARYGAGRMFALEHRTLTESPMDNALALARALPANAELHLVSHSRGGLVGELLTLGDATIASTYEPAAELIALIKEKNIRVTRFVRVACPARGTSLVSGRAEKWLSMLLSLAGTAHPAFEALQNLTAAIAHEGFDPAILPGLASMMPGSDLLRFLNRLDQTTTSPLTVIAGTTEAAGPLSHLALLAPNLFYGGPNDLVVNTSSMDGGVPRPPGALAVHHFAGPGINHLRYFQNEAIADTIASCLLNPREPAELNTRSCAPAPLPAPVGKRPIVMLLPGIMGSRLSAGGEPVWLNYWKLFLGELDRLSIQAKHVNPSGVLDSFYGNLIGFLNNTHDVVPFGFDWRISLRTEAARFAVELARLLDLGKPVRIVAHSMGGLLARTAFALEPQLWQRFAASEGCRFLMLGTPNGGSYEIVRTLAGHAGTVREIALLDAKHNLSQVLDIISPFPGLLEMLPRRAESGFDFLDPAAWEQQFPDPAVARRIAHLLEEVRVTQRLLDETPCDPSRTIYVADFGGASPSNGTPVEMRIDKSVVKFFASPEGDSKAPWATGIPRGIEPYYLNAPHADLPNHRPDFPALLELIETGETKLLPRKPPIAAAKRDGGTAGLYELHELPPDTVECLPGDHVTPVPQPQKRDTQLAIRLVHGDIASASYPVVVGHYSGDGILAAEASLDRLLDGRLSRSHSLGLYPNEAGDCDLFLKPDKGAIVAGLGAVGTLTPGALEHIVRSAVLRYALAKTDDQSNAQPENGLSFLFIGTMAHVMTIEESAAAILRGVAAANAAPGCPARISNIEFIELWDDRVIEAAHALATLTGRHILAEAHPGALRRVASSNATAADSWWSRLRISATGDGGALRFTLVTNRARAEVETLPDPEEAAGLIERAIVSTSPDPALAGVLFEQLIPVRFKGAAPEPLVLSLDETSAPYPWELLEDREAAAAGRRPIAVESGLIRQFETARFRRRTESAPDLAAFVVGNPRPTPFADLPGAEREARAVARSLEDAGVAVEARIASTADAIRFGFHARPYRILHFAGHGIYDDRQSAMVIGQNALLTAGHVSKLRTVPDLVFLNCCHLGRTGLGRENHLAARLAFAFIEMGARAVVAAGWAVDDAAAAAFATQFYQHLLAGESFGDAVRKARAAIYTAFPNVNTWGAYQCYGDPNYRLHPAAELPASRQAGPGQFVLAHQLTAELENILSSAAAGSATPAALRRRWDALKNAPLPRDWWQNPDVSRLAIRISTLPVLS